jgi:hypothetical protein
MVQSTSVDAAPRAAVEVAPFHPATMLVVLLGASESPACPQYGAMPSLGTSCRQFKSYLRDVLKFEQFPENVCDLYDNDGSPADILLEISRFIDARRGAIEAQGLKVRDFLLYFVGHGDFLGEFQQYHLMLRYSNMKFAEMTSLSVKQLSHVLREQCRELRRYLIIDACHAGGAVDHQWQGADAQEVYRQTVESIPQRGIAVLCSSSKRVRSLAPMDEACTMFTGALLEVLSSAHDGYGTRLSLNDVGHLVQRRISEKYKSGGVRPEVHAPYQPEGSLAELPLFPNGSSLELPSLRRHAVRMPARLFVWGTGLIALFAVCASVAFHPQPTAIVPTGSGDSADMPNAVPYEPVKPDLMRPPRLNTAEVTLQARNFTGKPLQLLMHNWRSELKRREDDSPVGGASLWSTHELPSDDSPEEITLGKDSSWYSFFLRIRGLDYYLATEDLSLSLHTVLQIHSSGGRYYATFNHPTDSAGLKTRGVDAP